MEKLTFSVELINAIMQYMATRPYGEVFQLINGLNQEAQGQLQMPVEQKAEEAPAE